MDKKKNSKILEVDNRVVQLSSEDIKKLIDTVEEICKNPEEERPLAWRTKLLLKVIKKNKK